MWSSICRLGLCRSCDVVDRGRRDPRSDARGIGRGVNQPYPPFASRRTEAVAKRGDKVAVGMSVRFYRT